MLLEVPTGNQGFLDGLEVPGLVSPPSVVLVSNMEKKSVPSTHEGRNRLKKRVFGWTRGAWIGVSSQCGEEIGFIHIRGVSCYEISCHCPT